MKSRFALGLVALGLLGTLDAAEDATLAVPFLNPIPDSFTIPEVRTTPEEAHRRYVVLFARMPGFGGERMPGLPQLATRLDLAGKSYHVEKPDLIGLDSSEGPRVYVAGNGFFNIVTLTNATQRARLGRRLMTAFETNAVGRLQRGESLVLSPESEVAGQERRMVGALHAAAECLRCHSRSVGTLGALSYRLTPLSGLAAKNDIRQREVAVTARRR